MSFQHIFHDVSAGLRAGFKVDLLSWAGKLDSLRVRSKRGGTCKVHYGDMDAVLEVGRRG